MQGFKEFPVETAKQLFSEKVIDLWSEPTLKAYFGVQPHTIEQEMDRDKKYASGVLSTATITLKHKVKERKGYLERLGLVHYELRGKHPWQGKRGTWFLVLENCAIVPEVVKLPKKRCVSNVNLFSTPIASQPIPQGVVCRDSGEPSHGCVLKEGSTVVLETDQRESIQGQKKNRSSESGLLFTPSLTEDEQRVLQAASEIGVKSLESAGKEVRHERQP